METLLESTSVQASEEADVRCRSFTNRIDLVHTDLFEICLVVEGIHSGSTPFSDTDADSASQSCGGGSCGGGCGGCSESI